MGGSRFPSTSVMYLIYIMYMADIISLGINFYHLFRIIKNNMKGTYISIICHDYSLYIYNKSKSCCNFINLKQYQKWKMRNLHHKNLKEQYKDILLMNEE